MKDFYDLWILSRAFTFDGERLARAIAATFERRNTSIPSAIPDALTHAFATDPSKQAQWQAFIAGVAVDPGALEHVVEDLAAFLMPHAEVARTRAHK